MRVVGPGPGEMLGFERQRRLTGGADACGMRERLEGSHDVGRPFGETRHISVDKGLERLAVIGDGVEQSPFESAGRGQDFRARQQAKILRSEEHTSELQSLMRNSYAVFCLTNKKIHSTAKETT